jgi:helicase MOV-10
VNASIILAGDPNQLGPVIYSQLGESLHLDQSYLERLMTMSIYRKNADTGRYDNTLITKLKKNYRSHPKLIHMSNRLFYDGEIEACGDKRIIYALEDQRCRILVNRAFPITLHATYGNTRKDANSTRSAEFVHSKGIFYSFMFVFSACTTCSRWRKLFCISNA